MLVGQRHHRPAGSVGLLLDRPRREDRLNGVGASGADFLCPSAEAIPVPLGEVAVGVGHVVGVRGIGPLRPVQPLVHGDALSVADDPHRALGGADLHLAAHIGERDGVPSSVEGDMVVKIDGGGLARDHLVGFARQRDEQCFLLAEEYLVPAALALLEGPRVDPGDVVQERRVERIEGCEDAVAERGDRLLLYDPDPISTAALSRGRRGRPGTTAHP